MSIDGFMLGVTVAGLLTIGALALSDWFIKPAECKTVSNAMWLEFMSLAPGEHMTIADVERNEFTVLHKDDFEHVLSLCNLRSRVKSKQGSQ